MKQLKNKAFTLVELIVVITILAILGTIAFISLQGYSKQARDSRRLSDVSNIKTSLELFSLNTGKYPIPDSEGTVSYSGETLFTQGFIGDNVTSNLSNNLQEKPLDPLHEIEYIYSTTNSRKEYEVLAFYEGTSSSSPFLRRRGAGGEGITYAANIYKPKITGNYNGLFVRTKNFIVPLPSIITSENLNYDLKTETGKIDSMIISGGNNYPNVGIAGVEQKTGELDINLSVYTGSINENSETQDKVNALNAIKSAYIGTVLSSKPIYSEIISSNDLIKTANNLFINGVGLYTPSSCASNPGYISAVYTEGTPIVPLQEWQNTNSEEACYYECINGYIGDDCSTPTASTVFTTHPVNINFGDVFDPLHSSQGPATFLEDITTPDTGIYYWEFLLSSSSNSLSISTNSSRYTEPYLYSYLHANLSVAHNSITGKTTFNYAGVPQKTFTANKNNFFLMIGDGSINTNGTTVTLLDPANHLYRTQGVNSVK